MNKILTETSIYITLSIFIFSCNSNNPTSSFDDFALYSTKEVFDSVTRSNKMTPIVDRYISIPTNQNLIMRVGILLDSVSAYNFNNLKIEVLGIDENEANYKILKINLKENPSFKIPDSLGNYRSWYDFFQGSMGGESTTILLIESTLQKQYKGEWVDAVEFYYQNEKIEEWDHIFLSGIIQRN
jgi:hypothetical protein